MTGETDNLAPAGTDNAQPSEADTSETWDYYDPDEDNVEDQQPGTDDETIEATAEDEAEVEVEPEADDSDEQAEALVTLADGTKVTQDELIAGHMRQSDYSRKTQEVANLRKAAEADAQRIASITEAFVDHLTRLVPPEPDPSLAHIDRNRFNAELVAHQQAIKAVNDLIELGEQPKAVLDEMGKRNQQTLIQEESQKLAMALPETATAEGRRAFFENVAQVAETVGFSRSDLQGVTDHRLFLLANLARKGLEAEKAKEVARAKVEQAAPAVPRKPGQPAQGANRNREAMRKLAKSGSLRDALAVDFE